MQASQKLAHNSGSHQSSSDITAASASQLLIHNILLQYITEELSSTYIASQVPKQHGCSGITAEIILPTVLHSTFVYSRLFPSIGCLSCLAMDKA
jgi:hypothetical protein